MGPCWGDVDLGGLDVVTPFGSVGRCGEARAGAAAGRWVACVGMGWSVEVEIAASVRAEGI